MRKWTRRALSARAQNDSVSVLPNASRRTRVSCTGPPEKSASFGELFQEVVVHDVAQLRMG
jgi:hypothetical protein